MSDLKKTNDGQVLICNERVLLCLEAAWELSRPLKNPSPPPVWAATI